MKTARREGEGKFSHKWSNSALVKVDVPWAWARGRRGRGRDARDQNFGDVDDFEAFEVIDREI